MAVQDYFVKGVRAQQSLNRLESENLDRTFTTPKQYIHTNKAEAYKAEAKGVKSNGGVDSNNNYIVVIWSRTNSEIIQITILPQL